MKKRRRKVLPALIAAAAFVSLTAAGIMTDSGRNLFAPGGPLAKPAAAVGRLLKEPAAAVEAIIEESTVAVGNLFTDSFPSERNLYGEPGAAGGALPDASVVYGDETGGNGTGAGDLGDPIDPAGNLSGFAYRQLPEDIQEIYAQLYAGIAGRQSEFTIRASDSDDISPALSAILTDCPEFFWIDGTASMTGFRGLGIWRITLGFNIAADEIDAVQARIDAKTAEYIASLPEGAGDYEKVKAAYEYLIRTTDYRVGSEQNQNIQSVFLYGESVCAGYARAFKYLCDRVGVECAYIEGIIRSDNRDEGGDEDEGHAWNLVCIDGVYTYVDPSWGDPTYGEDNTDAKRLDIIYDYLCLTGEEMLRARHVPDPTLTLPEADSRYYDYYILNGCYQEGYDRDRVSRALWHAVDEAESVVYLKFSDEEAYNEALYALFPEGEDRESLIDAPMRQRMEWDEISSIRYYYSCSKELYIIKIYW